MKHFSVLCVVVVGLLIMGQGCQSLPWQKNTMPPVELLEDETSSSTTATPQQASSLQMSPNQRIKDVPLPQKAKEDLERSYVYESANLQLGRMVYTINAPVTEVAQFYIDAAPAAGWKLINVKQAEGGAEMLFRKEGKKLEVSVKPLGLLRGQRLVLHLVPDTITESKF